MERFHDELRQENRGIKRGGLKDSDEHIRKRNKIMDNEVEMGGDGYKKKKLNLMGILIQIMTVKTMMVMKIMMGMTVNLMTVMINPKVGMINLMNLETTMMMAMMMMTRMLLNI